MAVAGRGARIVAEAEQEVAGIEPVGLDPVAEYAADARPVDEPSLKSVAPRELPGGECENAAGCKPGGGRAEQGDAAFAPWNVMQDAHQDDERAGRDRQVATDLARCEEVLHDEVASIACIRPEAFSCRRDQCCVRVDPAVFEVDPGVVQEASEAPVSTADVEHADGACWQRLDDPLPTRPGEIGPARIESLGVGLVEREREGVKLVACAFVHVRGEV